MPAVSKTKDNRRIPLRGILTLSRAGLLISLALLLSVVHVVSNTVMARDNQGWRRGSDWSSWQYDLEGSRFNSRERKITPENVSKLKLKWAWAGPINQEEMHSQPAVVGDWLYVGGQDGKLYALDAKSGQQKWVYDTEPIAGPPGPLNPNARIQTEQNPLRDGPAVEGDTVYFGDYRAHVYALNRHTGKLKWSMKVHDHPSAVLTSSPQVFDGKVFIGVSSHEATRTLNPNYPCCTFRGKVVALDTQKGSIEWQYYTVPQPVYKGTWPGSETPRYEPSGAGSWGSPVIDPETRTVFFSTGNNYTGQAGDVDALVAVSADTGQKKWAYRFLFPDTWTFACDLRPKGPACPQEDHPDYDVVSPNLFKANGRKLIGVGQKGTPFYHALDARTGQKVWDAPITAGVQWGSAYDGKRIYVGTAHHLSNPEDNDDIGALHAIDPATGKELWKTPLPANGCQTGGAAARPDNENCQLIISAAASATPGLVYAGGYDGKMRVYSADTGKVLWEYDTTRTFQSVNGKPVRGGSVAGGGGAVIANGILYVNSGYEFDGGMAGNALLAFSLDD